jgi:hypothetical protein
VIGRFSAVFRLVVVLSTLIFQYCSRTNIGHLFLRPRAVVGFLPCFSQGTFFQRQLRHYHGRTRTVRLASAPAIWIAGACIIKLPWQTPTRYNSNLQILYRLPYTTTCFAIHTTLDLWFLVDTSNLNTSESYCFEILTIGSLILIPERENRSQISTARPSKSALKHR